MCASIFDIVTDWILINVDFQYPFNPMLLRLLRMAKIARLVRLVRSAKGLRTLLTTISKCLPALGNVISLLGLCCLIFATMGMALFGDVIPQEQLGYGGSWPAFDTFGGAMLQMIMMATSEQWPSIMRACTVVAPFCGVQAGTPADADYDDCGAPTGVAVVFFVLYQLLGSLLMMNLTVGVVVDQFSSSSIQENMCASKACLPQMHASHDAWLPQMPSTVCHPQRCSSLCGRLYFATPPTQQPSSSPPVSHASPSHRCVTQTAVLEFQDKWSRLDPDGTYYISAHYLGRLLTQMLPPLGVRDEEKVASGKSQYVDVLRRLETAWLPVRGHGQVQFQEVLFALARTSINESADPRLHGMQAGQRLPECALRQTLDKQMRKNLDLRDLKDAPVEWNAHEYVAAQKVQRTYRGFRAREALHTSKQRQIKQKRVSTAFRISSTLLTSFVVADVKSSATALASEPSHLATIRLSTRGRE